MDVEDLLSPADVMPNLKVPDKKAALRELSGHLASKLSLDPHEVLAAVLRREDLGSTGMGDGVAVPHARLNSVMRPAAALARLVHPVAFDAIDEQPVDIMILLLLPAGSDGEQLNALAYVARKLRDPEVRERLRRARERGSLYAALMSA